MTEGMHSLAAQASRLKSSRTKVKYQYLSPTTSYSVATDFFEMIPYLSHSVVMSGPASSMTSKVPTAA